jgi:hypothetical protein
MESPIFIILLNELLQEILIIDTITGVFYIFDCVMIKKIKVKINITL